MLLFLRLFGPINQLLFVVDVLQSVAASLNRMIGVITTPGTDHAPVTTTGDQVRLDAVSFGYDSNHRVLEDIDLNIPSGQRVALVGVSGAGKTTVASILAGIHHPDAGTVNRPERTAVISQEVHVFAGTLRENLTLAAPNADDSRVHSALEATGAHRLLGLLPRGLDTVLGAGGHELTAAEAQQVALARIVLADPDLAILDEATAEAGSTHADLLDAAAEAALNGRTGLVIAHRLSQAAACDRIVVMDQGRIIETGTHQELLAADGVYSRLWEAWTTTNGGSLGHAAAGEAKTQHTTPRAS